MADIAAIEKVTAVLPDFQSTDLAETGEKLQVHLVEMTKTQLETKQTIQATVEAERQQWQDAEAALESAKASERESIQQLEAKANALLAAQAEFKAVEEELKIAEESSREYREAGEQLRAAKVTHEMQLELFAALRSGTWTEKEQHEKLPSLKDYLQSIALEKTLVAAAEGLKTSPDARGGFDQMAIDCIAQELGEKMKALEEQLLHRAPAERQLEASLLGLQALADVCDQKAQAALAAHQLVEEKMKGFTSSIKALKQQVVKHAKQLESSTERLKAEQAEREREMKTPEISTNALRSASELQPTRSRSDAPGVAVRGGSAGEGLRLSGGHSGTGAPPGGSGGTRHAAGASARAAHRASCNGHSLTHC
ncbi:unnamed protein product [Durusdinium trenchii]|uniref:Uncharacterized protein n=1 Tax=Durusdinium trenchii TaxID=1381693 RepID=A0ABP0Q4P8_9DINO